MPSLGQTLTCFVKTVFGITSLHFIYMSDILAMVWDIWLKKHIKNIDHFKNEDYLKNEDNRKHESNHKND